MTPTSVYLHFPFCAKRCPYCDFATEKIERAEVPHVAYADAVLREIDRRRESLRGRSLCSIFVGGGTPSLWDARELGRVIAAIQSAFAEADANVEITVECNPSSLDDAKAAALREAGVNRLSIGVQSLDAATLQFLGRLHDGPMALAAVDGAVKSGLRVSVDLMFGMPNQTAAELDAHLRTLVDHGARHVSAYALTIEPETPFGALHRKGRLLVAPEDDYVAMFLHAERAFSELGFSHYEVSNYAMAGEEARHNQHYWRGGAYLGLGAAAVGCLDAGVGRGERYRNTKNTARYLVTRENETDFGETLGPSDLVNEAFMLGLRTSEGVDLSAVARRAGVDPRVGREAAIEKRQRRGDLVIDGDRMRVPHARWLALDSIVADLF